jgi:3-(3-hydroxy-phenyl)propionate hydroxylase
VRDETLDRESDLTLEDLRAAIVAVWGSDFGLVSADMMSRFTDATRQAANYRAGRVLLAGDAAHIHSPAGGQGLNLGVQDAVNLGWKLAEVVTGAATTDLLDSYHAERHPVTARVLTYTMALTALQRGDDRTSALIEIVGGLLDITAARDRLAGLASGLDIHYDLGGDHPLIGRRMPDLDLATAEGPLRVYTLLHRARPVLINLGQPASLDLGEWTDRVQLIDAIYQGAWELPVLGAVAAPAAVLVRPDGHVAWAGDEAQVGLEDALGTWFGPPATP